MRNCSGIWEDMCWDEEDEVYKNDDHVRPRKNTDMRRTGILRFAEGE